MPPVFLIIFIIVMFGGSFAYIYFMNKKRKESLDKYDNPQAYAQVPQLMQEMLNNRFSAITRQMQGAPIDAFTQCAYIASVADKAKSAAATAAKTLAWAAVGVKARYNEADHAAYLVLSGEELHYLFFVEGEAKEHLVFDRYRLQNAATGTVNNAEKVTRMGSVTGRKSHKLSVDIEGKRVDVIYYDAIERYPETILAMQKNAFDSMGQFKLLGRYFKEQFYTAYPHLRQEVEV